MSKESKPLEREEWQTKRSERVSYGLYFFGQNLFYMIVSAFITLFLLNKGLNEALIATILIVPKIWDAVNDPLFGVFIDKVKFRKGRFLPWLKISWIFIPLTTIFLFSMPDSLPIGAKVAWAIIGYVLWDTSYTMCDAPIFALSTTMSSVTKERTSILALGRVFATIATIVATLAIEATYMSTGWMALAIGLSVIAMILMFPVLVYAKERNHGEIESQPTIREMFSAVSKNKYLIAFLVAYFFIAVTMSVEILIPIFAQYVLGSTDAGTILLGICTVPMILIAAIVPALARRIDKFHLFIASLVIFVVSSIVQYFTNYNDEIVLYITTFVRAIGFGGYNVLLFMFLPDVVEYGQYKTGKRQEGICFSMQTFMTKLTAAILSSLSLVILTWFGYTSTNADPITGMVDATAGQGFWTVFTLISIIGSCIGIPILLIFYKLRDKDVQIITRHNNGEISREECDAELSRKY